MESMRLFLGPINGAISVNIIRKDIKNVHLKVFRTLKVVLSIPYHVPDDWIRNFLDQRVDWIDKQVSMYKKASGNNTLERIKNGTSVQLLGKDMRIVIIPSLIDQIELDEKQIIIYCTDRNDVDKVQREFQKWWRSNTHSFFQEETAVIFKRVFKKYDLIEPTVCVRKMKTLWGSCTSTKSKITLNEYLIKANESCIEYVIMHELTHLLYPNHSKEFYDFLTIQMPNWQERKKQLDHEVAQGL